MKWKKDKKQEGHKKRKIPKGLKIVIIVLLIIGVIALAFIGAFHYYMNSTATGISPSGKHYPGQPISKSETVYIDTDSHGQVQSVVVDAYLRNNTESKKIVETTNLTDIVNINGGEEYQDNGNGTITWPANGNDIYYEGLGKDTSDVPVSIGVKYYLDKKKISGKKLEGKSGDLEIHIKYKNNKTAMIDGEEVITPFVVLTALIVEDGSLSKIRISNGKVISTGGVDAAMGISIPGFSKMVKKTALKNILSDEIIIKAKAKKFEGNEIISMVSNDLFKNVSNSTLNKLNADKKINLLNKSTIKLVNGSEQLTSGIKALNTKIPELTGGITVAKDATELLEKEIYEALVAAEERGKTATELTASLCLMTQYVSDQVGNEESGLIFKTKEQREQLDDAKANNEEAITSLTDIKSQLEGIVPKTDKINEAITSIDKTIENLEATRGTIDEAQENAASIEEDLWKLEKLLNQGYSDEDEIPDELKTHPEMQYLKKEDGSYMSLINGSVLLNTKTGELYGDLQSLMNDDDSLMAGLNKLTKGMRTLNKGGRQFQTGVTKLYTGSNKLSNGMQKYYNTGIKKVVDMYDKNLKGLAKKVKMMKRADMEYNNYSGLTKGMNSSVKFFVFTPFGSWNE